MKPEHINESIQDLYIKHDGAVTPMMEEWFSIRERTSYNEAQFSAFYNWCSRKCLPVLLQKAFKTTSI